MVNLVRWDPLEEFEEIQKQIFGSLPATQGLFAPTTDVYVEDNKQLVVEAHLPGFDDKDVEINVHEGVLEIRAEKHEKEESKKARKYVVRETGSSFYRKIRLPKQSNEAKIEANLDNGTLKVVVPFKSLPKPKKIAIKSRKLSKKTSSHNK